MNKLKIKVFFTIFIILTLSLCSFIIVFNIQKYNDEKKSIINNLDTIAKMSEKVEENNQFIEPQSNQPDNIIIQEKKDESMLIDENLKFMDSVVYTILLDNHNNIKDIINHSQNDIKNNEISIVAKNILEQNNIKDKYIGCLYLEDYSYSYISGISLTILDNSATKTKLISYLEVTIIIFILLEGIVFLISRMITKWIIKPVKSSFDKQKQFIADASHELKTPLSVIIASSEALQDNPKELKWLNNIRNEADRMSLLITDLLELAESENDVIQNLESDNLSKIVELSVLTFEGRTFEKNLKLDYKIEDNISIKMNENSIRQLVEILLDNAIKHSKEKGCIEVYLKQNNNDVILEVKNQGEAIPIGEEEKIFERFYRVDKSRNRNDNRYGLGLAIAKNIAENHNGKISAKSNNGKTTFKVIFRKA